MRKVEQQGGAPEVPSVYQVEVHTFANDAFVSGSRRTDKLRRQHQIGVVAKRGR